MNAKAANRVVASVQISSIRLLKIDAAGPPHGFVLNDEPAIVNVKNRCGLVAPPSPDGTFIAIAEFQIDVAQTETGSPFFTMNAHFELCYKLPSELEHTEDEMREFVSGNVPFNAWPYLRELLQSTTTRVGMAPVGLPLYRHGQQSAAAEKKETK